MRHLKALALSLIFLSLIILAFAALIPSKVKVSRALSINANQATVRGCISDTNSWQLWFPYFKNTPKNNIYLTNSEQKLSDGKYTLGLVSSTDSILQLQFITSKSGASIVFYYNIINQQQGCVVNCYTYKISSWLPWQKFRNLIADNVLGSSIDSNLAALKNYAEKQ